MFILVVELNLAKCRLPKVQNLFLSFESSNARKILLDAGESRSWGPRGGKVGGTRFFFLQAGGN